MRKLSAWPRWRKTLRILLLLLGLFVITLPWNLCKAPFPCYYGLPKDIVTFSQDPHNFSIETSYFSLVKIISRVLVSPFIGELKLLARNV